jgi:hypothetical protein
MFKAVCKGWNCAHLGEASPFDPWILKSELSVNLESMCRSRTTGGLLPGVMSD